MFKTIDPSLIANNDVWCNIVTTTTKLQGYYKGVVTKQDILPSYDLRSAKADEYIKVQQDKGLITYIRKDFVKSIDYTIATNGEIKKGKVTK